MKGNFEISIEQMLLDETLSRKRPYAVLVVSTTGLDGKPSVRGRDPPRQK